MRTIGFIVSVLTIVAACAPSAPNRGAAPAAEPARVNAPKAIVVVGYGSPPAVDFRFSITSSNSYRLLSGLYAGALIVSDNSSVSQPKLAERVPSLDNGLWRVNPDNTMETRLTLRPTATWHDGTPLTTRDILFNDEVYLDRSLPQVIDRARGFVSRLEAVDDRTLAIHWKEPYILADIYSPDMMPAHILEESYRANRVPMARRRFPA